MAFTTESSDDKRKTTKADSTGSYVPIFIRYLNRFILFLELDCLFGWRSGISAQNIKTCLYYSTTYLAQCNIGENCICGTCYNATVWNIQ